MTFDHGETEILVRGEKEKADKEWQLRVGRKM